MRSPIAWFFAPPKPPHTPLRVVGWWELRRIPFNLLVGAYGFVCLVVFFCSILTSGVLKPGEDAVEPLAMIMAPFFVNAAYTLGWIVEIPARIIRPSLSPRFGPGLMKLGVGFGLALITVPAAYWGGYRVLQLLGVIK